MNTETEESKEILRIQTELNKLIDDYNNTAHSSSYDQFAKLNKTYLENLQNLEIEITNKYTEEKKNEYEEKYYPIIFIIKKETEESKEILRIRTELNTLIDDYNKETDKSSDINQTYLNNLQILKTEITNKYTEEKKNEYEEKYYPILFIIQEEEKKLHSINFNIMNDELKRLDEDELKRVNNNINQNIKNIGFNLLWIVLCIILIILIDNSISDWIFGILLFGNCLMLFINSVKYLNNKFYKSQLDKHKKSSR